MEMTLEKSTNEKLKFAYELTISMLPEPLKTLAEKGKELAFRDKTAIEKTAEIIEQAVEELLKNGYGFFGDFFKNNEFDFSGVKFTAGAEPLAKYLYERYVLANPTFSQAYLDVVDSSMRDFAKELFSKVNEKIDADSELHTFWKLEHIGGMVTDIHNTTVKAINRNADYRNKWNERCCLHKSEAQPLVNLETIYVMPEVQVGEERLKVGDCVKDFLENDTQHILLLLGHGGYGKTSFVARMAAKTKEYTDRPLHIFRLREFADAKVDELYKRISEFSQNKLASNAVLVFDGLDELCMVGGGDEEKKSLDLIYHLTKFWRDCTSRKIIVTSRPQYVNARLVRMDLEGNTPLGLDKPVLLSYEYAVFADHQRTELVDRLEQADGSLKNSVGCQHVRAYSGEKDDPIYGSPFLLYLICAGKGITEECFSNRWLLFRTVFHDININPAYRGTTPTQQEEFARNAENAEKLYRITSRLAYEIYKTGYEKQYFQKEEVLNIIRALYPAETPELISALGDCYALCAYFKQTENGAVEFAHNHVRDFFLCEYILQGLDDCYAERANGMSAEDCGKLVADWLSDHFKYREIDCDVVELMDNNFLYPIRRSKVQTINFIQDAGLILKLQKNEQVQLLPQSNKKQNFVYLNKFDPSELHYIFDMYCKNGGLSCYKYGSKSDEMSIGILSASKNVIRNASQFFYFLFFCNSEIQKIKWFDKEVFESGDRKILENMYTLMNADLTAFRLGKLRLKGMNLSGAKLAYSHLLGTDLSCTDLRGTDLDMAAMFGATIEMVNLENALYNDHTKFSPGFDFEGLGMRKIN